MFKFVSKIVLGVFTMVVCDWSVASANSLIDNSAYGYVKGDVIQTVERGGEVILNVGSIAADKIKDTKVVGYVGGDVVIYGGHDKIAVNIGSVIKK